MRVWLALVACASAAARVAAVVCPRVGMEAPLVTTLMASATNPSSDAWIFRTNCVVDVVSLVDTVSDNVLSVFDSSIERVESVPSLTKAILVTQSTLTKSASFVDATALSFLSISDFSPSLLRNLELPDSIVELVLADSTVTSLAGLRFPSQLRNLKLKNLKTASLKGIAFPANLDSLEVTASPLAALDLTIPSKLRTLIVNARTVERVTFPDTIEKLDLSGNGLSTLKGNRWPSSLKTLDLDGNQLRTFEIRRSDLAIFRRLEQFTIADGASECLDASGELVSIKNFRICVISDERFTALYINSGAGTTQTPATSTPNSPRVTPSGGTKRPNGESAGNSPSGESSSSADSSTETQEASGSSGGPGSTTSEGGITRKQTASSGSVETSGLEDAGSASGTAPSSSRKSKSPSTTGSKSSSDLARNTSQPTSSHTIMIVGVIAGVVVAIALGICIYRVFCGRRRDEDSTGEASKYSRLDTPNPTAGTSSDHASSQFFHANDIRHDKALLPFRIDQSEIHMKQQVARGGFGLIYRAVYQGRDVAVKQMLPGGWQNDGVLASFMDEIRLCAKLDHPKIVSFVGIAWHSLRELSVVIEFMPGGDLHALLCKQQDPSSPDHWKAPWTADKIRSKKLIACDVAEAVVYLHAFNSPIVHRDLKSRNVLLDTHGNAKLSDFGISRQIAINETMTSEIGTAAWIAPEVLRGERYNEKADIYSLGVLLVELDRCSHPYASEGSLGAAASRPGGEVSANGMHLALLVSTGKLRPNVSSSCPDEVKSLVNKCLSFDAADRPTAAEVATAFTSD